jgi:FSR family fosmidomycin resistance protein-like MFS transporter
MTLSSSAHPLLRKNSLLAVLGTAHGFVDAACAALVFGLVWRYQLTSQEYILLVVGYNVLAFAFQPLCGLVSDRIRNHTMTAAFGIVLTGLSLIIAGINPFIAVGLAGLGNAVFHVGGGAVSLLLAPGRASAPGLFVAPGALGIAIGAMIGRNGPVHPVLFLCLLGAAFTAMIFLKATKIRETVLSQSKPESFKWPVLIGALLLVSIMIRSLVGFSAGFPWHNDRTVLFLIVCAAFLGKALGGVISDRFGWLATALTVSLVSAPLLAFGFVHPVASIAGMLLFQMTMPVTLTAVHRLLPKRPAFSFGLTCLALIIGAAPVFTSWKHAFASWSVILLLSVFSAGLLFTALSMLQGNSCGSSVRVWLKNIKSTIFANDRKPVYIANKS